MKTGHKIKIERTDTVPAAETRLVLRTVEAAGAERSREADSRLLQSLTPRRVRNWYRSARQGDPRAQYNLGILSTRAGGDAQDYKEAYRWFRKAAVQDYAPAQTYLGLLYEQGLGVTQNAGRAISWYRRAAQKNNAEARFNLARLYLQKGGGGKRLRYVFELFLELAEEGLAEAQNQVGLLWQAGQGVACNVERARAWFEKAAEQGHAEALYNLAELFETGAGVERDPEKAAQLYHAAAEAGCDLADFKLGTLYHAGEGVASNPGNALFWMCEAMGKGDSRAHDFMETTDLALSPTAEDLYKRGRELHDRGTTIILTTHYLEEAEELCDSIAIVNHGEIVACEPTPQLLARLDYKTLVIHPKEPLAAVPDALTRLDATIRPTGELAITFRTSEMGIGRLLEQVRGAGIGIGDLVTEAPDLEDVFLALTSQAA